MWLWTKDYFQQKIPEHEKTAEECFDVARYDDDEENVKSSEGEMEEEKFNTVSIVETTIGAS